MNHMPPVESVCTDPAAQVAALTKEIERRDQLMRALLRQIGIRAQCRYCKDSIVFVKHVETTNAIAPYDFDGVNHHDTCRNLPRKKEKSNAALTRSTAG